MKREAILWEDWASFPNLLSATPKARYGKMGFSDVQAFEFDA
jgi:hypothetical protein